MRRLALAIAASVIAAACSSSTPAGPGPIAAGSTSAADDKPSTGVVKNWVTHLIGEEEVPPRETRAQGEAKFQLSADGSVMSYQLISSNIDNVVQAHIHVGPVGCQCPISVFLYGAVAAGGGPQNGLLASGEFSTADIINANLTGVSTLAELVAQMDAGNTYVNVHTNDGVSPTNTGPGDFPGGEVRGQIERAGH